ncbi:MAG TPA: C39 family peptidase [Vicinamibacteria bacterium]|nr:C39 family peptidase [Vicinamibacteria bacterium]
MGPLLLQLHCQHRGQLANVPLPLSNRGRVGLYSQRIALLAAVVTFLPACPTPTPSPTPSPINPVGPGPVPTSSLVILPIQPTIQETPVWCWAAAGEMVLRYYGLPNVNPGGDYQCGIVASWFVSAYPECSYNCALCQFTIGPMSNEYQVITLYGVFLRSLGVPSRVLSASLVFRALSADEIKAEVDARRPIVVGIAPGGGFALPNASQHIAVLVGYDLSASGQYVVVNDPFPFEIYPYNQYPHPYLSRGGRQLQVGQFRIPLNTLTTQLLWANSIYHIQ